MKPLEFAPLQIRRSSVKSSNAVRYRVEQGNGQSVVVEAESAAEAASKSGVKNPTRIVNMELELQSMVSEGDLERQSEGVSTSIDLDAERKPRFFIAELEEQGAFEEPFQEMGLGTLADLVKSKPPISEPAHKTVEAPAPIEASVEPVEAALVEDPVPVREIIQEVLPPEMPGGPAEDVVNVTEAPTVAKELTQDEVERLLNSKDLG